MRAGRHSALSSFGGDIRLPTFARDRDFAQEIDEGPHDGGKLASAGIDGRGIGYLHVVGANKASYEAGPVAIRDVPAFARKRFPGPLVVNGGFDGGSAEEILSKGDADLVAFGVPFIANPDLVARLSKDAELNTPDPSTFYGEGPKGYTDYPAMAEDEAFDETPASSR